MTILRSHIERSCACRTWRTIRCTTRSSARSVKRFYASWTTTRSRWTRETPCNPATRTTSFASGERSRFLPRHQRQTPLRIRRHHRLPALDERLAPLHSTCAIDRPHSLRAVFFMPKPFAARPSPDPPGAHASTRRRTGGNDAQSSRARRRPAKKRPCTLGARPANSWSG